MNLINRTRNSIRTILTAGVLLAVPVLAVAVHAQPVSMAKFTLPYEVRWNKITVPAGEYTMLFKSEEHVAFIRQEHGRRSYLIGLPLTDMSKDGNAGLVVTNTAGQHTVRILNIPELG